jgi:hypothetical protein
MNSANNSNWQFAVTNNRLTFVSFHIVFLSFCRSWENVTPAPGSGIQNSAPAPASEKPPELRQNSGSGNSGAQHYFCLHMKCCYRLNFCNEPVVRRFALRSGARYIGLVFATLSL